MYLLVIVCISIVNPISNEGEGADEGEDGGKGKDKAEEEGDAKKAGAIQEKDPDNKGPYSPRQPMYFPVIVCISIVNPISNEGEEGDEGEGADEGEDGGKGKDEAAEEGDAKKAGANQEKDSDNKGPYSPRQPMYFPVIVRISIINNTISPHCAPPPPIRRRTSGWEKGGSE